MNSLESFPLKASTGVNEPKISERSIDNNDDLESERRILRNLVNEK